MKKVKNTIKEISITNPEDGRKRRKAIFELEDDDLGVDSEDEESPNEEEIKSDSKMNSNNKLRPEHGKVSTSGESSEEETECEDSDGENLDIESSDDEVNTFSDSKTRKSINKESSCNKSGTKDKSKTRETKRRNEENVERRKEPVDENNYTKEKQKRSMTNSVESEIDDENDELESVVSKKKKLSHSEEKFENVVR